MAGSSRSTGIAFETGIALLENFININHIAMMWLSVF